MPDHHQTKYPAYVLENVAKQAQAILDGYTAAKAATDSWYERSECSCPHCVAHRAIVAELATAGLTIARLAGESLRAFPDMEKSAQLLEEASRCLERISGQLLFLIAKLNREVALAKASCEGSA